MPASSLFPIVLLKGILQNIPLSIFAVNRNLSQPTATSQKPRWNATLTEVKGCETVQSRGDANTFIGELKQSNANQLLVKPV